MDKEIREDLIEDIKDTKLHGKEKEKMEEN